MSAAAAVERVIDRPHGIRVPYAAVGAADLESARAATRRMVALHSMGSTALHERDAYQPLVDRGWVVVTFDQRGHGAATPATDPERFTPHEMAGDLLAILDDLGWSSAWLYGGSMGCVPSLAAAARAPHRVEGLFLLAPAFGASPNVAASDFAEVARAFRDGQVAGLDAYREWASRFTAEEPALSEHVQQFAVHDPASVGVWMEVVAGWTIPNELEALESFRQPVLVLSWPDDPIHPWALGEELARRAPEGRFVTPEWDRLVSGEWVVADVVAREIAALDDPAQTQASLPRNAM